MIKIPTRLVRYLVLVSFSLAVWWHPVSAPAASHTWTGAGSSGLWSLAANWSANNPPAFGEASPVTVTFPSGAARLNNTNDLGRLTLDQLNFLGTGYTINGSGSGTNLTLQGSAGTAVLNTAGAINTIDDSVNLSLAHNVNFTVNTNGSLVLASVVKGSGGLTKLGVGTLTLYANFADTYAGNTYVTAGTLKLYCGTGGSPQVAVPGYLEIGGGTSLATVQLLANSQISATAVVKLNDNGVLDLNNFSATCGPLTFDGGAAQTGSGTLTLGGDVTVSSNKISYLSGKLSLGGVTRQFDLKLSSSFELQAQTSDGGASAGLTQVGKGALVVDGSNTFSGPIVINSGAFYAYDQASFGTGAGGVTVNSNGILYLVTDYMIVSNISLTLDGHGSTTGGRLASIAADGYWYGPVQLASDSTFENVFPDQSWLVINGPITGPGGVKLIGGDAMYFAGDTDNTYTGTTYISSVQTNSLGLSKDSGATAISGPIVVGDPNDATNSAYLVLNYPNQIANNAPITINPSGVFDLSSYNEAVGGLTLFDGLIKGTGILTLLGNVTNYGTGFAEADILCPVSLGGQSRIFNTLGHSIYIYGAITDGGGAAGITKAGPWFLGLGASNSYAGLTVVNEGTLSVDHNHALGSTAAGTILAAGAGLLLDNGKSVVDESLSINGPASLNYYLTNAWTGPILLAADLECDGNTSDDLLTLSGAISGPGSLTAMGDSTLRFTGTNANTFTGPLIVTQGLVELAKTNAIAVAGSLKILPASTLTTVRYRNANQIADTAAVTVNFGGTLDLNNFSDTLGDFSGSGTVTLGSAQLTVGGTNPTNIFSGIITGNGLCELDKTNGNTLILSGPSTYAGNTFVKGGTLLVNGSQPASAVYAYPSATVGGNGTVGSLFANGGTISPGNSPGKLNCGFLTFNTGSTYFVELKGTNAGTTYDQLNVTGTISINSGVTLGVSKTFAGVVSNQFIIANNDLADAVSGTFNGLANGATFTASGTSFRINYNGGSGNDIVLTQLSLPLGPQITGVNKVGGTLQISGTALANMTYQVQASTNLSTTNWISLGSITANGAGAFQFSDPPATPSIPQRFYRLFYP